MATVTVTVTEEFAQPELSGEEDDNEEDVMSESEMRLKQAFTFDKNKGVGSRRASGVQMWAALGRATRINKLMKYMKVSL